MLKYLFTIITFFFSTLIFGQKLTARILDVSQNPIAFATIQTAENKGVISNEEGFFTINLENNNINTIEINSLGFTTKTISIEEIKRNNYIVVLDEFIDVLSQVYVSNSIPDVNDIIYKANKNLSTNYSNENIKYNLFFRNTSFVDFNTLEFKIDKVSGLKKKQLTDANIALEELTNSIIESEAVYYRDYVADLLIQNKENSKLDVYKATRLLDKKRSFSIDDIQNKAQHLILTYLDTTKTYKLKSGLFKIEDSLSLKSADVKEKEEEHKNEYEATNLTSESHDLIHKSQIYDDTQLKTILDADLYSYQFENTTVFNDQLVYIITYSPRKGKAKYSGKLYITDENFAIIKLEYKYAKGKRGQKLNLKLLLGVKFIENLQSGIMIFKKNDENIYQPLYLKEESGNFFYVSRPLKMIENSFSKNKIGLNFKLEGNAKEKNEIYFINHNSISISEYNSIIVKDKLHYQELKAYDPSIWAKYNALEPLEEMKNFKSKD